MIVGTIITLPPGAFFSAEPSSCLSLAAAWPPYTCKASLHVKLTFGTPPSAQCMLDTASPDVIIEGEGGGQQWGWGASCASDRGFVHRHVKAPGVLFVRVHLEVLKWDWISVFRLKKSRQDKIMSNTNLEES